MFDLYRYVKVLINNLALNMKLKMFIAIDKRTKKKKK